MNGLERTRLVGYGLAKKSIRLLAAAFLAAVLAGCGGGDDAPAAQAPTQGLTGVATTSGSTTLSWMPPTTNDDGTPLTLTGYRIYWGHTEGHYPHSVTVNNPGLSRYVVEQLTPATYYFVATALSRDGESPPSNVVQLRIL